MFSVVSTYAPVGAYLESSYSSASSSTSADTGTWFNYGSTTSESGSRTSNKNLVSASYSSTLRSTHSRTGTHTAGVSNYNDVLTENQSYSSHSNETETYSTSGRSYTWSLTDIYGNTDSSSRTFGASGSTTNTTKSVQIITTTTSLLTGVFSRTATTQTSLSTYMSGSSKSVSTTLTGTTATASTSIPTTTIASETLTVPRTTYGTLTTSQTVMASSSFMEAINTAGYTKLSYLCNETELFILPASTTDSKASAEFSIAFTATATSYEPLHQTDLHTWNVVAPLITDTGLQNATITKYTATNSTVTSSYSYTNYVPATGTSTRQTGYTNGIMTTTTFTHVYSSTQATVSTKTYRVMGTTTGYIVTNPFLGTSPLSFARRVTSDVSLLSGSHPSVYFEPILTTIPASNMSKQTIISTGGPIPFPSTVTALGATYIPALFTGVLTDTYNTHPTTIAQGKSSVAGTAPYLFWFSPNTQNFLYRFGAGVEQEGSQAVAVALDMTDWGIGMTGMPISLSDVFPAIQSTVGQFAEYNSTSRSTAIKVAASTANDTSFRFSQSLNSVSHTSSLTSTYESTNSVGTTTRTTTESSSDSFVWQTVLPWGRTYNDNKMNDLGDVTYFANTASPADVSVSLKGSFGGTYFNSTGGAIATERFSSNTSFAFPASLVLVVASVPCYTVSPAGNPDQPFFITNRY